MEEKEQKEHIDIQKETLKPITKAISKEDKELQEQEVESTGWRNGSRWWIISNLAYRKLSLGN